ncbi:MFS general substrate transporter [Heliocybe sulcata]|uniref:MFS general substrate transporter n=1 Tax=Heliocybe sulcata TaxID=5364 RepID=A0A5C3N996_9AGAM|nr:MFS general substrate transporter [Heliocybe sulcata]
MMPVRIQLLLGVAHPHRFSRNYNLMDEEPKTPLTEAPATLESPAKRPSEVVDRGLRAWLTVFGAFFSMFATFGQMNAIGSFQLWYAEHQLSHYSQSDIAWIGSLQLWVFFFSGGIIGRLFDAYGPKVLLALGTVIYTFSLMMTSLATKYSQFILAQGVLFGIGVGLLFYPALSSTQTHFMKYRATAAGIAYSSPSSTS